MKNINVQLEKDKEIIFSLVLNGLRISTDRGLSIISYTRHLIRDHENNPAYILKQILPNLKSNGKYFASFVAGNHYAPMVIDMDAQQLETFLSGIVEILKISDDKESEIVDYLTYDVIENMTKMKLSLSEIIKNMVNSKFNDNEKTYMFFLYGTNF